MFFFFFFKLPYFELANCRTPSVFHFLKYISQFEIVANETFIEVDFQYAYYFGIEKEWKMLFNTAKTLFLDGTGCLSDTSWHCFTMFCNSKN